MGSLNSTFITLISKVSHQSTFVDYILKSLCNTMYKLISKIISNHIKEKLSKHITLEKFGFFDNRYIQDLVAITRECLHYTKTRHQNVCLMMIDIVKSYDNMDWELLQMIIDKTGFKVKTIDWIMTCITLLNYNIIINWILIDFSMASGGIT